MSADEIDHQLLGLIQSNQNGVTNDEFVKFLTNVSPQDRVSGLNKLLQQGLIEVLKKGDKLIYRGKAPKKTTALPNNADNEEKIVYGLIEEGGNKGVLVKDIRTKSNLNITQLNKIFKNLESKKLIKGVKSVNVSYLKEIFLFQLKSKPTTISQAGC